MNYNSSDKLFENLTIPSYPSWPYFISSRSWCVLFDQRGLPSLITLQDRSNIGEKTHSVASTRDKGLKSIYRKRSRCWTPNGSQFDWYTIPNLRHRSLRVRGLPIIITMLYILIFSNDLDRISPQSCLPIFFSEKLVQVFSCRHCLLSGVSWLHYKVSRNSGGVCSICDLMPTILFYSRIGYVVRRSGHCEGISWIGWRPDVPRNRSISFRFLYTQGVVP